VSVDVGARGSIPVRGLFAQCDTCGEVYFGPGEMDGVHRAAASVVREREGLLSSSEILALREDLGLTQAQLEQLLRVGPKTVVRWERGTVFQNRATDTLLRAIRDVPETRVFLLERAGLPVTEFSRDPRLVTLEHALIEVPLAADELTWPWSSSIQWAPILGQGSIERDDEALAA
jgi:HTH-type transcriptional regulator/antitoxin MqsA